MRIVFNLADYLSLIDGLNSQIVASIHGNAGKEGDWTYYKSLTDPPRTAGIGWRYFFYEFSGSYQVKLQ